MLLQTLLVEAQMLLGFLHPVQKKVLKYSSRLAVRISLQRLEVTVPTPIPLTALRFLVTLCLIGPFAGGNRGDFLLGMASGMQRRGSHGPTGGSWSEA